MRSALPLLLLSVALVACDGCVPQEVRQAERINIQEALARGATCAELEDLDDTGLQICREERDRLRLRNIAADPPEGLPAFDYRDAFLCLYPPTVRNTPWSDPEPMPDFVCRVPAEVMDRLR